MEMFLVFVPLFAPDWSVIAWLMAAWMVLNGPALPGDAAQPRCVPSPLFGQPPSTQYVQDVPGHAACATLTQIHATRSQTRKLMERPLIRQIARCNCLPSALEPPWALAFRPKRARAVRCVPPTESGSYAEKADRLRPLFMITSQAKSSSQAERADLPEFSVRGKGDSVGKLPIRPPMLVCVPQEINHT